MKKIVTSLVGLAAVAFASAQTPGVNAPGQGLSNLIAMVQGLVRQLTPLLIGIAVLALFVSLIMFIWKGKEDKEEHAKWAKAMGMSVLAIFVMVSIWGLVGFLGNITGVGQGGGAPVPGVPVNAPVY